MTFKDALLALANTIAKEANEGEAAFPDKIDALAELTKLYVAMQKHPDEKDDETGGFDFVKGVTTPQEGTGNGPPRVHSRRRPSAN